MRSNDLINKKVKFHSLYSLTDSEIFDMVGMVMYVFDFNPDMTAKTVLVHRSAGWKPEKVPVENIREILG